MKERQLKGFQQSTITTSSAPANVTASTRSSSYSVPPFRYRQPRPNPAPYHLPREPTLISCPTYDRSMRCTQSCSSNIDTPFNRSVEAQPTTILLQTVSLHSRVLDSLVVYQKSRRHLTSLPRFV